MEGRCLGEPLELTTITPNNSSRLVSPGSGDRASAIEFVCFFRLSGTFWESVEMCKKTLV